MGQMESYYRHLNCSCEIFWLQLAAVSDGDFFLGLATLTSVVLNLRYNIHTLNDWAKYTMLSIKMWCFVCADEELRAIGIWSCICHGQDTCKNKLKDEVKTRIPDWYD